MPRREARTVLVRARAGARELHELSRSAWLDQRAHAKNVGASALLRVPHDRPYASRPEFAIHHESRLPELPYQHSWQQQSGRRSLSTINQNRKCKIRRTEHRFGLELGGNVKSGG